MIAPAQRNRRGAPSASGPAESPGRTKEELLKTVSASRLGTWLGCRLKFYFRYVAGIVKPTTPARQVGSVVHLVLQQWNLARWRRAPLAGEMVEEVFDAAWTSAQEEQEIPWDAEEPEDAVKAGALGLVQKAASKAASLRVAFSDRGKRPPGNLRFSEAEYETLRAFFIRLRES